MFPWIMQLYMVRTILEESSLQTKWFQENLEK